MYRDCISAMWRDVQGRDTLLCVSTQKSLMEVRGCVNNVDTCHRFICCCRIRNILIHISSPACSEDLRHSALPGALCLFRCCDDADIAVAFVKCQAALYPTQAVAGKLAETGRWQGGVQRGGGWPDDAGNKERRGRGPFLISGGAVGLPVP